VIKLAIALFILGVIGAFNPQAGTTSSPPTPTISSPAVTAPAGGEPGIVAGPPNPGYGVHCGHGPLDDDVRTTIHVRDAIQNPPCEGK
jgi:hypothetical protein